MASLRPSEYRLASASAGQADQEPTIGLEDSPNGGIDVYFRDAIRNESSLILNVKPDMLSIYPINVRPDKMDYLFPKYGALERIMLPRRVNFEYDLPESPEDVAELLELLPEGFAKQWQFGLGLHWEYRFICEAIAQIPDVTTLIVHGGSGTHDAKIDPPIFTMGLGRYHGLRKEINRAASRHQRAARAEKELLSYQWLLHTADKLAFPRKRKRLSPDSIADMTNISGEETKLSKRDRRSIVKLLNENVNEAAKDDPQALLGLKADIERVTLAELITRFESQMTKNLTENRWQSFFMANPFVLSLAFSVPAILIQDNPYLGGARFDRKGGKIGDFLLATATTGNLAIVEIKKPATALLAKTEYRESLFAPSGELSGALSQVLDQRFKLQKHLPNLKDESGLHDIHAYSVRCIVICGITPQGSHEKKSLELVRNSLSDVTVVTFDELLARLKQLHAVLSNETATCAPTETNDIPF